MSLEEAISSELESVLLRANNEQLALEGLGERIHDVFCWITWSELSAVIGTQAAEFVTSDPAVDASVQRLANSVGSSIAWHA